MHQQNRYAQFFEHYLVENVKIFNSLRPDTSKQRVLDAAFNAWPARLKLTLLQDCHHITRHKHRIYQVYTSSHSVKNCGFGDETNLKRKLHMLMTFMKSKYKESQCQQD